MALQCPIRITVSERSKTKGKKVRRSVWYHQRKFEHETHYTNLENFAEPMEPPEHERLTTGPYAPIPILLGPTMLTPNVGGPGLKMKLKGVAVCMKPPF
jgi:hypothetical protein